MSSSSFILEKLKFVASVEMGQSPPSSEYSLTPNTGLPFLQGTADFGFQHPTPRVYCPSPTKTSLPGDILFSVRAPVGTLNIADTHYGIGRGLCAVRCGERVNQSFAWWALHWSRSQLAYEATGSTYEAVASEDVANVLIPLPNVEQQYKIADYLDRETQKIDALIGAKKRLLELLVEKRKALITQAVTRGLKPDVPTRDSGLSWIGKFPQHWSLEHLKYHLSNIEQGWSPQSDNFPADLDEWGVLKVGAVNGWDFNANENKRIPPELDIPLEYEIKSGDILVSRANTTELVGSASLVKEIRPRLLLCDKLYRPVLQSNRLTPEYLVFYLRSLTGRFEFERDATGASSSMQNISQGTLTNLWIPIPPLDEQISIVVHIENQLLLLEKLEITTKEGISLLQERRTSLISAAVTGQIQTAV